MKVSATRMEFLKLKNRIKIAKRGHKLLKEKRDQLMKEFFEIEREAMEKRKEAEKILDEALKSFAFADATSPYEIELFSDISSEAGERVYSFITTPLMLDSAVEKEKQAMKSLKELAEIEDKLYKLAEEIERIRRRVNALEHIFIPELESSAKYIKQRLEEIELENIMTIMKIKELAG